MLNATALKKSPQTGFKAIGRRSEQKIKRAIRTDPDGQAEIMQDMAVANAVYGRMTLLEQGFVSRQLRRAAANPSPSDAEIALLVTFAFRGAIK